MRQCFPEPVGFSHHGDLVVFKVAMDSGKMCHVCLRSKFHWVILSQRCVPAGNVQQTPRRSLELMNVQETGGSRDMQTGRFEKQCIALADLAVESAVC